MAGRLLRISTTFRRSVARLGFSPGSAVYRAVTATLRSLGSSDLPATADYETVFSPGRAHVRRVAGHNLWILYRYDDANVFVMTVRSTPPAPVDDDDDT